MTILFKRFWTITVLSTPVVELYVPQKPWYNENIHLARRVKRRLERKWRKSKLDVDREAYVEQLSELKQLIDSAKVSFSSDKLATGNVTHVFKTIHNLLNTKCNKLPVGESSKSLSDKFASFFRGKILKIRNELDVISTGEFTSNVHDFDSHDVTVNCALSEFTPADQE